MSGRAKGTKNKTQHIWTEDERAYLAEVTPGKHHKEILQLMNDKFENIFTIGQIKGAIKRYKLNTGFTGHFPKGNIPFNKNTKGLTGRNSSSFKKGHRPVNYRPVGSERVNVDGYIEIKVADPKKWRLKHQVVWEKEKGPIPKGYAVIFGDGNRKNLKIDNLILVSREQLLIMNHNKLIYSDADSTRTGVIIADIYKKIAERKGKSK